MPDAGLLKLGVVALRTLGHPGDKLAGLLAAEVQAVSGRSRGIF